MYSTPVMAGEPLVVWSFRKTPDVLRLGFKKIRLERIFTQRPLWGAAKESQICKPRNRAGSSISRAPAWLLVASFLCGCTEQAALTQLEEIKRRGTLNVATRIGPATYHPSPNGVSGIEYDLAQLYAQRLGVQVNFVVYDSVAETFKAVEEGRADVAAAGLAVTDERKRQVRFTPAYRTVTEQVVYREGSRKPQSLTDLTDGIFEVSDGGSHLATLERLRDEHSELQWRVSDGHTTTQLLYLVHAGLIDYTAATSDQTQLIRRYLPQLRVAFDLGIRRSLAWAFRQSADSSLYDDAVAFFNDIKFDRTLDQLNERYYGQARDIQVQHAEDQAFRQHVRERLPQYRRLFHQAALRYNMDWRLLAAIAYQESKWDPRATSPTGVRGMMMLTEETAKQLNVKNRLDPRDSIMGGAYYVAQGRAEMPVEIAEPDRTWLALVKYNAGPTTLEKARQSAERSGYNPDRWLSVKKVLAVNKGYYQDIRAKNVPLPGRQSVDFVESVRRYYDLLVYLSDEEDFRLTMFQNVHYDNEHSS